MREGFIVPVPLSEEFWALVRDIDIASSSLPRPGAGYSGEFTGLMADYVRELQKKICNVQDEADRLAIMKEEAERKVGIVVDSRIICGDRFMFFRGDKNFGNSPDLLFSSSCGEARYLSVHGFICGLVLFVAM